MSQEQGVRRRLPAGIIDAGFASLATFIVGLAAVTRLDDVGRGVYAVFFVTFVIGTLLSNELIFTPAEVKAVSYPTARRLSLLSQSLVLGIGPTLLGTLSIGAAILVTQSYAETEVLVALVVTAAISMVLSPMQDHVRRMLHIAERSWQAASISTVQFFVAAASVGVGILIDLPAAWIPFGALALANSASISVGLILTRSSIPEVPPEKLGFRDLASTGAWFVLSAAAPALAAFAVVALIGIVVSPEDLGYAESARIVAQPLLVLAAGLTAVLAPRSMRSAMEADRATARRTTVLYLGTVFLAGIGYTLAVGWDWALNPMAALVPSAYVLSGLVPVTIASNVISAAPFLQNNELAGAGRERILARTSWLSSLAWLAGGLTAWLTGAFARPIGALCGGAARYGAQSVALQPVYDQPPRVGQTDALPTVEPS